DAISFEGATVADPRTISEDESLEWKIVELYDRLQLKSYEFEKQDIPEEQKRALRGLLVLQADKTVEAKVLNRVMKTAYAANYPNIMFATNKKAGGHD